MNGATIAAKPSPDLCEENSHDPAWICSDCGDAHGRRPAGICTFHIGECDICGRAEMVTEPRDYGHLKDTWRVARTNRG